MNPKSFLDSTNYRSFINQRDQALERIALKYRIGQAFVVDHLKDLSLALIHRWYVSPQRSTRNKAKLESELNTVFLLATAASVELTRRLKRRSYLLAHVGEAEAMRKATGKNHRVDASRATLDTVAAGDTFAGGSLYDRTELSFNKLKRDLITKIEQCLLVSKPWGEAEAWILRAFPKGKTVKLERKNLRKLKEADIPEWLKQARAGYRADLAPDVGGEYKTPGDTSIVTGIIDSQEWEAMVQDYVSDNLPVTTFTRTLQDYTISETGEKVYDWEVERDTTTDFVKEVRSGQNKTANENGIVDMLWIAVSHKTECESCQWRDGLTSQEIEDNLKGEHSDDDIDAIVPPAHPNCYCKVAPVTQDLLDLTPETTNTPEFEAWLNS